MQITVKLFASFRAGRTPIAPMQFTAGTTIADVVAELAIPVSELGIIMVNSRHAPLDRELAEGDILALFPLLGGG
jgi:molybdopterin converting factor small subunit